MLTQPINLGLDRRLTCFVGLIVVLLCGCSSSGSGNEAEHQASPTPGIVAENGDWATVTDSITSAMDSGDMEKAAEEAEKALRVARKAGPEKLVVTSLHNLAKIKLSQGQTSEAIDYFEEAVTQGEKLPKPDPDLTALSLNKLAAAYYTGKKPSAAMRTLERALEFAKPGGRLRIELLQNLATVRQQQGDLKGAQALLEEIRVLRIEAGGELPCEGLALLWHTRAWPNLSYRLASDRFIGRRKPVNRNIASARYMARVGPEVSKPEEDTH